MDIQQTMMINSTKENGSYSVHTVVIAKQETVSLADKQSPSEMDNTSIEELQRCAMELASTTYKPQITLKDVESHNNG